MEPEGWTEIGSGVQETSAATHIITSMTTTLTEKLDAWTSQIASRIESMESKMMQLETKMHVLELRNREVLAHIQYQRGISSKLEAGTLPFDTDPRARAVNLALRQHIPIPLEKSRTHTEK